MVQLTIDQRVFIVTKKLQNVPNRQIMLDFEARFNRRHLDSKTQSKEIKKSTLSMAQAFISCKF